MQQIHPRTWVEIKRNALVHNMQSFRRLVGDKVIISPCVKANAYGYGLVESAQIFLESGADWLSVDSIYEAVLLRESGVTTPIYIFGYVTLEQLPLVVEHACKLLVNNYETVRYLQELAEQANKKIDVHIKVETGNNRQGLSGKELLDFAQYITLQPNLRLEGVSTHFANIEDVPNHDFAELQRQRFEEAYQMLLENNIKIPIRHVANSAAAMMYPKTHYDMVRPGIASYGMWPSELFQKKYQEKFGERVQLQPALTWKTVIAQIKSVAAGETIGYGRTYVADRDMKIAIVPVGYYDGFDRKHSNVGHVLIRGQRAPVVGRVCMNITMVGVTDILDASLEDEVVLIGKQGEESITPEDFAEWIDTINYEVTTRIRGDIPRIVISSE